MPIYEYECLQCGKRTEVLQRMGEGPIAACPACGGEVKKLISSPAFQFKGSGWYVTDYGGKKGGGSEGKSEGKSEAKSESKSEGKSESASESKSEGKAEKPAASESKSSSGSGSSGSSE
jgi:putative FmdB family regulatory protein